MDATDYLETEEVRGYMEQERERVLTNARLHPEKYRNASGDLDPKSWKPKSKDSRRL